MVKKPVVIPHRSIDESLLFYKANIATRQGFGMDIYAPDFKHQGVVLFQDNGIGKKGLPIRCNYYLIVLCIDGEADRTINQHSFRLRPHTFHVIKPGDIYSLKNATSDFDMLLLMFEPKVLDCLGKQMDGLRDLLGADEHSKPCGDLSIEDFLNWRRGYEVLNVELKQDRSYQEIAVAAGLIQLLSWARRGLHLSGIKPKVSKGQKLYIRYRALVEKSFNDLRSVKDYAEPLQVTSKHLSETVKSMSTKPALHFLHDRQLREAEYLLGRTEFSISDISRVLKYDTVSHFGRFFKGKKGVTPQGYRDSLK